MILSIESSCDDSSIAITKISTKEIIFHKKISQEKEHSAFGGVVPELASRLHAKVLPQILEQTKVYFKDLKAIGVTTEPGLNVTLLEGLMMAKTLSFALDLPLMGINHLKGHIYSLFLEKEVIFPMGILLVSGGHTMLLEAYDYDKIEIVAQSIDDSFGESFDKTSKMLGLGYPGGPIVESFAKNGNSKAFSLPLPLKSKKDFAFSFSGLKNAVRLEIEKAKVLDDKFKSDLCASFQEIATLHLIKKCEIFFEKNSLKKDSWRNFGVVGGASANLFLREKIENLCKKYSCDLHLAPLQYCSDNAVMIGRVGVEAYLREDFSDLDLLEVKPRVERI